MIFIIANHNPRSTKLETILRNLEVEKYSTTYKFDLRFYVASFAGYGLHADCIRTLAEFQEMSKANKKLKS